MTPIQALFLTCQPVIDIAARCISDGEDYPPEIPGHVTKLLEVKIVSTSPWNLGRHRLVWSHSPHEIKACAITSLL